MNSYTYIQKAHCGAWESCRLRWAYPVTDIVRRMPAISLPNHYRKSQKWGIEPNSQTTEKKRKRKADPFQNRGSEMTYIILHEISGLRNYAFRRSHPVTSRKSSLALHHTISLPNHYRKTKKWGIEPNSQSTEKKTKTQSRPIFKQPATIFFLLTNRNLYGFRGR